MPNSQHLSIKVSSKPSETARAEIVRADYDYRTPTITEEFTGDIIMPDDWHIGMIVGASGTGKSTIIKTLYPDKALTQYAHGASVIDDMPEGVPVKEITKLFSKLGFSSVPSWLKPYSVLSMGERMRVDLAHAILTQSDPIIFDEFTSVVDRTVAENLCIALGKYLRESGRQFIAVGCHYDVLEWLQPDWAYDTSTSGMILPKTAARVNEHSKLEDAGTTNGTSLPDIII